MPPLPCRRPPREAPTGRREGQGMRGIRRRALLAAAAAAPPGAAVRAQGAGPAWPQRPVRPIVPFAPGQPVIVEARPGAGGALGIQSVVAANDPHLLLVTTSAVATLPAVMRDGAAGFDPLRDLVPITLASEAPMVLRARPGAISYASSGAGSTTHLAGALLCAKAGIDLLHVPYRGAAQAVNALYAGDTDSMVTGMGEGHAHLREGRLRALCVTGPGRLDLLPGVPAAAEAVPGYAMLIWYGMLGPRATPPEGVGRNAQLVGPLRGGGPPAAR